METCFAFLKYCILNCILIMYIIVYLYIKLITIYSTLSAAFRVLYLYIIIFYFYMLIFTSAQLFLTSAYRVLRLKWLYINVFKTSNSPHNNGCYSDQKLTHHPHYRCNHAQVYASLFQSVLLFSAVDLLLQS